MIKHFSVTAVKTFRDCPRKWFDQYVLGKKGPPSEGLTRGDAFHGATEARLLTGKRGSDYDIYVDAVSPFFAPPEEAVLVEHWMRMKTKQGPDFIGKIDYIRPNVSPRRLLDWKTTSDPRWMLTPEEVREDVQTNIYAHYLFEEGLEEPLEGGLIYVLFSKAKKAPKSVDKIKVVPVIVDISRERARKVWDELQPDLDQMMELAWESDRDRVEAKITACDKYGGCPSKSDCGISSLAGLSSKTKKKDQGDDFMSFRDRLKNKNGQAGAGTPVTEEKQEVKEEKQEAGGYAARMRKNGVAPAPGQVVPDDAPPRDSGGADPLPEPVVESAAAETVETPEEAPVRRGRPKGSTSKKTAGQPAVVSDGFTIFVDCWPVKGYGGTEPTLFDDWIGPMLLDLNEWAEKEKKVPHYQLLSFSEEKALVALAVAERIKTGLPTVLAVSTASQIARDVLPMLLPHATQVVRALRG